MIYERRLANGLLLAIEENQAVGSVSLAWLVPGGTAHDRAGAAGEGDSQLLAEYMLRGAGRWESRAHSDALDALGVDRSSTATKNHLSLSATLLSQHLPAALELLVPIIVAPRFDPVHLEPVKSLALQSLEGLEDEPQHLAMVRLSERFFPPPLNRSGYGHEEGLRSATIERLRNQWSANVKPGGSILAIAGRVQAEEVVTLLESRLREWSGSTPEVQVTGPADGGTHHVSAMTAQTHLAMALWAPAEGAPEAMLHRLAVRIFGGETSSRLFTEVREKRGLCYSVSAGASMGRALGMTSIYAGSTHDRAARTLAQIRAEIARLAEGVTAHEFERAAIGFKSRLVMNGESMAARASALAADLHRIGRARSLEELARGVDAITLSELDAYVRGPLADRWSRDATLVVVGPRAVEGA